MGQHGVEPVQSPGMWSAEPTCWSLIRAARDGQSARREEFARRYAPLIESTVADLANSSSKRQAGTVYAAQFLREFVDGRPWCHLDIAGTATPGGRASGYGVRLVHQLAKGLAGR
mgnify:CR=1 FL=1